MSSGSSCLTYWTEYSSLRIRTFKQRVLYECIDNGGARETTGNDFFIRDRVVIFCQRWLSMHYVRMSRCAWRLKWSGNEWRKSSMTSVLVDTHDIIRGRLLRKLILIEWYISIARSRRKTGICSRKLSLHIGDPFKVWTAPLGRLTWLSDCFLSNCQFSNQNVSLYISYL